MEYFLERLNKNKDKEMLKIERIENGVSLTCGEGVVYLTRFDDGVMDLNIESENNMNLEILIPHLTSWINNNIPDGNLDALEFGMLCEYAIQIKRKKEASMLNNEMESSVDIFSDHNSLIQIEDITNMQKTLKQGNSSSFFAKCNITTLTPKNDGLLIEDKDGNLTFVKGNEVTFVITTDRNLLLKNLELSIQDFHNSEHVSPEDFSHVLTLFQHMKETKSREKTSNLRCGKKW